MTDENHKDALALRAEGWQPKNIARKLGLRPAEVEAFLRKAAAEMQADREARGELPELLECVTDEIGARWLLDGQRDGFDESEEELQGLSHVFVTRLDRGKRLFVGFLVDYWCLGVKDTLPSRRVDLLEYSFTKTAMFSLYGGTRQISLEQAQAIVYGAIEYARKLGFEPHPDTAEALTVLGPRPESLLPLEFGKNGRPMYLNGPDDDVDKVLATLNRAVGEGNYGLQVIESDDDYLDDEDGDEDGAIPILFPRGR